MSHLSTIMSRVHRMAEQDGDKKKNSLMTQSVRNLKEYIEYWDDYTQEEEKEAMKLYNIWKHIL